MKILSALAFVIVIPLCGCVVNRSEPPNVILDEQASIAVARNLDFPPRTLWLASMRAMRDFFLHHPEHRFFAANDLEWCYPEGYEEATHGATRPYKIIRTWYVPLTLDEPVIGKEYARKATIKIISDNPVQDGRRFWQCQILLVKCWRPRLPLRAPEEGWYADDRPDIEGAIEIKRLFHMELDKIERNKRLGISELDY